MIKRSTRGQIKGFLEGFIQGIINEHKSSSLNPKELRPAKKFSEEGDIKPFHEALLPDGILRITEFERSFSTKLGTTFEEVAKLIGKDNYAVAERGHVVCGKVSPRAIKKIESIVNKIGSGGMEKSYLKLAKEVVKISMKKGETRRKTADLYLKDNRGNEIFFEIKSPKPNKGQCLEATDRLLQIHAIRRLSSPKVRTYYAMAYNPYGDDKKSYAHSFSRRYMDLKNQVLIGKEFWDLIGGEGTYKEVLEVYREVGREKGPDMIDQLALGY
jgi:hypothetical protein